MSSIGIALLQAVPVIIAGITTNNKIILVCTAIIMILIAGSTGRPSYFFIDAIFIGIAYFVGLSLIKDPDKIK